MEKSNRIFVSILVKIQKATIAIFLLFLLTPPLCTAKSVNYYGAINQIEICVEAKGYKDFAPHYQFQRGEIPHTV